MPKRPLLPVMAAFLAALVTADAVASPLAESALWAERSAARGRPAAPTLLSFDQAAGSMFRRVAVAGPADARHRVRLLQDVHRNAEAQRFVSAALKLLADRGEAGLVAVEGAWTAVDVRPFHEGRLAAALAPDVERLLAAHALSGAAHAALTDNRFPRLVGMDDASLHRANAAAYRRFAAATPAAARAVAAQEARDVALSDGLPPALRRRVIAARAYRSGRLALADYARTLPVEAGSPLDRFLAALAAERAVNAEAVRRERVALLSALSARLTPSDLAELLSETAAVRVGRLTDADFYDRLLARAARAGLPGGRWPALTAYARYARLADGIDVEVLLRAIDAAEDAAILRDAGGDRDAAAAQASRDRALLAKLMSFSLSPDEWARVSRQWTGMPAAVTAPLEDAAAFYRCSEARDGAMAARLLGALTDGPAAAVAVAGGFHTPGLVARLASAGVRVEVYRPRLTAAPADGSAYLSEFARVRTPLERLVEGDRLFLAAPPLPAATRFELAQRAAAHQVAAARWPFARVAGWLGRATGWTLVDAAAQGGTVSMTVTRRTDREVSLRVTVPVARPDTPIVVTPLTGGARVRAASGFSLAALVLNTFGFFLVPLALCALFQTLPAGPHALGVLKIALLAAIVFFFVVAVAVPAFTVVTMIAVAATVVVTGIGDRFRTPADVDASLQRRLLAGLASVVRTSRRDPMLAEALAVVDAIAVTDDDKAVLQGGKVVQAGASGGVERFVLVSRTLRFAPGVVRYLILRRALGFQYDLLSADMGGDDDPTFRWSRRLFWEIHSNVRLLRHWRTVPTTVPYTVFHLFTWGTAAIAGAGALLVLAAWRDGRPGVARTVTVWRTLAAVHIFRERGIRWTPQADRPFPRRAFVLLSAGLLAAAAAATFGLAVWAVGPNGAVAALSVSWVFLAVNFMTARAFGRLIQENSNAYRAAPSDGPALAAPALAPEAVGTAAAPRRRYTDREVTMRAVLPIEPVAAAPLVPVTGARAAHLVVGYALVPTALTTFGVLLVPLLLKFLLTVLPAGPVSVAVDVCLMAMVVMLGTIPTLAVVHLGLVVGGIAHARLLERSGDPAVADASAARRVGRAVDAVQRAAAREPVLAAGLGLVNAIGITDDNDAVAQGGKVVRPRDGGTERIIIILRSMRFSPFLLRYLIVRRAIGFHYDHTVVGTGADLDPAFVWHKRLFWEIYGNVMLLRHARTVPTLVPYTLLHLVTMGTTAAAGAVALLALAFVREGPAGVARTVRIWRTLAAVYIFRQAFPRWEPGPRAGFPRRRFEAVTSALLGLATVGTYLLGVHSFGLPAAGSGLVLLAAGLFLHLMTTVAMGRLLQENSNAYRVRRRDDPPPDAPGGGAPTRGPTDPTPTDGAPEALGRDIAAAADALAERRAAGETLDRVAGGVVIQNLGRDLVPAPADRPAFTPAELARVVASIRRHRRATLTPREAALLMRAWAPDAPADARNRTLRFLLRAEDVDAFAAWLSRAPTGVRVAVIADAAAAARLALLPAALRRRFELTADDVFVDGQASARSLERALSGLSDADVADTLLVLPAGVGLLPDGGDEPLSVLRRLLFLRLEELMAEGDLRAAPVAFALEAAALFLTQA